MSVEIYNDNELRNRRNQTENNVSEVDEEYLEYKEEELENDVMQLKKYMDFLSRQSEYSCNQSEETMKMVNKEDKKNMGKIIAGGVTSVSGTIVSCVSSFFAFGPIGGIAWTIGLLTITGITSAISYDKGLKRREDEIDKYGDISHSEVVILEKKLKEIEKMTPIYQSYLKQKKYFEENKNKMSESQKKKNDKKMLKTLNDFCIKANEFRKKYGENPVFDINYYLRRGD